MEGKCYDGAIESTLGTVMSYCQQFSFPTFHPLCKSVINAYVTNKLKIIQNLPEKVNLLNQFNNNRNFLIFNSSPSALSYVYELSSSNTFTNILLKDSSRTNILNLNYAERGKEYFIRVKSKNDFGEADWSNIMLLRNETSFLKVPSLVSPNDDIYVADPSKDILFEFEKIVGATGYEIQIANFSDIYFKNALNLSTGSNNFIRVNISNTTLNNWEIKLWRVRALNDGNKSDYSEFRKIVVKNSQVMTDPRFPRFGIFPDFGIFPTKFSLNISHFEYGDVHLKISEKIDYTNPVIDKIIRKENRFINENITFFVDNLKLKTKYFIKIEFINSNTLLNPNLPKEYKLTHYDSFQTVDSEDKIYEKFFHRDNFDGLGVKIDQMVLTNNSINYISGNSLSILNTETLLIEKFNKQKTNGEIGINWAFNFLKVDTHGNISKIVQLAKVNQYKDGFPKVILALRKYKMNTLELISSEEFTTFSPYSIIDFDPNNNLLNAGSQIYQIRNGETFLLNKMLSNAKILFSKTNIVWLSIFNEGLSKSELIEYDLISNSYKILAAPSDKPYYSISNFKIDSKGNFWAVISNKGLGKFDGNVWIFYNMDNSPIDLDIYDFDINKFDEIYVLSNSVKTYSSINGSVHLFSNNSWTLLLRNFPFRCAMKVDNQGNLWFNPNNSSLLKVDKCSLISIPKIRTNTNTIVVSQNVKFTAEGCDNVFWQWNSSSESGEQTILGSNNFELFVKASTTIKAKCLSNNCSSSQVAIEIKLGPKIRVSNALPNKVCIDEEIKIFPSIQGTFEPDNQFVAILKKDNFNFRFLIEKREGGLFIKVGSVYLNGKYALTISSTSPSIKSEDILEVFLTNSPRTKISGNKTICGAGETIIAAITDFGTAPFKYSWYKDSNPLENMNSLFIKVSSKGVYKIQVIDAMNCSSIATEISINQYDFPLVRNLKQSNGFVLLNKPDTLSFITLNDYKIEWYKDGNIIYGETTNKLIVKEAGKYIAIVDNNGCKNSFIFLPISMVLGDEVISSTINFNISPNPFNEQINIDLSSAEKFSGNLILVDIKGKIISEYSIKDEFSLTKQIKTNQLSSGTYFIKFVEKRFTKSYKIIKY